MCCDIKELFSVSLMMLIKIMKMMMTICSDTKDTSQIMANNKQRSPNVQLQVESCIKLIRLVIG